MSYSRLSLEGRQIADEAIKYHTEQFLSQLANYHKPVEHGAFRNEDVSVQKDGSYLTALHSPTSSAEEALQKEYLITRVTLRTAETAVYKSKFNVVPAANSPANAIPDFDRLLLTLWLKSDDILSRIVQEQSPALPSIEEFLEYRGAAEVALSKIKVPQNSTLSARLQNLNLLPAEPKAADYEQLFKFLLEPNCLTGPTRFDPFAPALDTSGLPPSIDMLLPGELYGGHNGPNTSVTVTGSVHPLNPTSLGINQ